MSAILKKWGFAWVFTMGIGLGFGINNSAIATPTSAEGYRIQGLAYRQQGRLDDAIAAMETAVELDPESVSGQVLLGWTQHLAKDDEAAAITLSQALQLNPFKVEVSNALGIVYLVQGQLSQSILTHLWATQIKPNNEIAYFNLSLAAQRIGYYEWAIELAARAAELEPYNPHPLIAEAIAHWSKDDPHQAQRQYREATHLSPRYGTAQISTYLQAAAFSPEQIKIAQRIIEQL